MEYEFEGRTEKEAIELAIKELGLERDQFDVEILHTEKSGMLGLHKTVHIKVHTPDGPQIGNELGYFNSADSTGAGVSTSASSSAIASTNTSPDPENDFERDVMTFLKTVLEKMNYEILITIMYREDKKFALNIDSEHNAILIGRRGKNLDALQLLVNAFATHHFHNDIKIIVDIENYRGRREEALIRLAHKAGDQVIKTQKSKLLEPMNPFERRLVHSALNDVENVETLSEGDGLIKQIRVSYKGL